MCRRLIRGYIEIADKVKQGAKGIIETLPGFGIKILQFMTEILKTWSAVANELWG